MPLSRSRPVLVLGALALVGVATWATGVAEVRAGEWSLAPAPSPAPARIRFEGRDYDRGGEDPDGVPSGWVVRGRTSGGGRIFSSAEPTGMSTLLFVEDGPHVYAYGLMGGP